MGLAVKKTISLPEELAKEVEETARREGKTLSGVVQDALRLAQAGRRAKELRVIQNFWSKKAQEKGVLNEDDLDRILNS